MGNRQMGDVADGVSGVGCLFEQGQPLDIIFAVESLVSSGSLRMNRPVAPLPDANYVGAEARSRGHDLDGMTKVRRRHERWIRLELDKFNPNLRQFV